MTTQQLAELEAKAEAERRAEQSERMAMRAVDQVAPQMGRINHVGLIASWNRRK